MGDNFSGVCPFQTTKSNWEIDGPLAKCCFRLHRCDEVLTKAQTDLEGALMFETQRLSDNRNRPFEECLGKILFI